MKAVVQRVSQAQVNVAGDTVAEIAAGYLVLIGIGRDDTDKTLAWMARKLTTLRVFGDTDGRMSLGLDDVDGQILVVSQFTLYGDAKKGTRPSFDRSCPPERARELYDRFVGMLEALMPGRIQSGEFQAMMDVSLVNSGPVTILVEKE